MFLAVVAALLFAQAQDPRTLFEQGLEHQRGGRLSEAERSFAQAARLAPRQSAIFANLGVVRAQLGNFDGAIEAYKTALLLNPSAHAIHRNMAIAWFKMSDFSSALSSLDTFLKTEPLDAQASELRGLSLHQVGRYPEALDQFRRLIAVHGQKLPYLYALGQSAMRSGDRKLAESTFARVFELFPDAAETHLLHAQSLMSANRYEAAVEALERAAKQNPRLPGLHLWRGIGEEGLGRPEEARKAYQREIEESSDPLAYYAAGILEGRTGDPGAAVRLLERALPIDSDHYNVSYYLGRAYMKMGRHEAAIAPFERSLARNPKSTSEHYLLLEVYRKLGRTDDARRQAAIIRELKLKQVRKDQDTLEEPGPFKP